MEHLAPVFLDKNFNNSSYAEEAFEKIEKK